MPLVEMGERLREGRLKRGLSVEEVASQLKISLRLIRDLETGTEPSMPHAVYVRGFIKSYGKMLDINPDDLVAGLAAYTQAEEGAPTPARLPPRPRSNLGLVLLALVCAIAFAGYWYYNVYVVPARQEQSVPSTRLEPAGPPSEPAPVSAAPSAGSASPSRAQAGSTSPAPASQMGPPAPAVSAASGVQPATAQQPVSAEVAGEDVPVRVNGFRPPGRELPATGSGRGATVNLGMPPRDAGSPVNQLVLTGTAECWVHATADDTDTRQFSIQPGDAFSLSFNKVLIIKLGNAGGVRLKYNGVELPAPGKEGQVRTMRFPENGPG